MPSLPSWQQLLPTIIGTAPTWLAYLIGVGLCFRHASQQPRRAVWVGTAIVVMAMNWVVNFLFTGRLFDAIYRLTDSHEFAAAGISLLYSIPNAFALCLLFWAAFSCESSVPEVDTK